MGNQKTVVLMKVGSFGLMRPEDYEYQIEMVTDWLHETTPPAAVETVESVEALRERLTRGGVDAVIWFTRSMIDTAAAFHHEFGIRSILCTGLAGGISRPGVIVIKKWPDRENFCTAVLG